MLAAEREGHHAEVFHLSLCDGLSALQLQRLHQVTLRVVEILKAASGEGCLRMTTGALDAEVCAPICS